jgi:NAD(P)H-flavin reductase/ferredoxin
MNIAATRQARAVCFADGATGTDTVVDCAPGETVLLAGLRAGLPLPYECASGGCGSCRAQLVDGSVRTRWEDATGLSERDRRRGNRILLCQSLPDPACRVRVTLPDEPLGNRPSAPARCIGTLVRRDLLSNDTAQLVVDAGEPMPYLPGQFVLLEFEDGVRRAYSMSRPPQPGPDAGKLELLVRAKPGGAASAWIFDRLSVGATVTVEGPYGKAHAQSPTDRPVVCLAGGTGLAPILAIAEHLSFEAPTRHLDVYVGSRQVGDIVLADRLSALAEAGANVVAVVENNPDQTHPVLGATRTGLALGHLAADLPDLAGHDMYIAGPSPMIEASLRRLLREGTALADRVFFDRFIA